MNIWIYSTPRSHNYAAQAPQRFPRQLNLGDRAANQCFSGFGFVTHVPNSISHCVVEVYGVLRSALSPNPDFFSSE